MNRKLDIVALQDFKKVMESSHLPSTFKPRPPANDLNNLEIPISKEIEIYVDKCHDIIDRIYEILEKKGLSQKELAAQSGKNKSEICRWLNGKHNFTLRTIAKIEAILGEEIIQIRKKKNT